MQNEVNIDKLKNTSSAEGAKLIALGNARGHWHKRELSAESALQKVKCKWPFSGFARFQCC